MASPSTGDAKHPPRNYRNLGEAAFAASLLVVAIVAIGGAFRYGLIREDGIMGAGFIPLVGGGIVLVCAATIVLRAIRGTAASSEGELEPEIEATPELTALEAEIQQNAYGKAGSENAVLRVFACMFVALLLSYWTGLIAAFTLLVFTILFWVEKEGLARSIAGALITGVSAWLIFVEFLGVPILWPGN